MSRMIVKIYYENNILDDKCLCLDEVHIWIIRWNSISYLVSQYWNIIEDDEKSELLRYKNIEDCMRSLTGKILSRKLLSNYLGTSIQNIRIVKGKYGKPYMHSIQGYDEIRFSISHSNEFVVLAFTEFGSIGVDIEENKEFPQILRKLSNSEINEQTVLSNEDKFQNKIFYDEWTAKEAYVKALGLGLQKDLRTICIQGDKVFECGELMRSWKIISVNAVRGYSLSVAVNIKKKN